MTIKIHICYKCVGGLGLAPAYSLVGGSASVSPHGPRLMDPVGPLPSGSLNPISYSSTKLPKLCLMFDCGSLHLCPLAAG